MSYKNIPAELRAINTWILWRNETLDNNKITKVPYNAKTGYKASVTDASTWTTFDAAVLHANLAGERYSGLGRVLTLSDDYTCIDLDNPNGNEEIIQRQLKIHETFNSYSEISPSGKGLHIWVKGKVPSGARRGNVEVYSSGRFMTMTGNVYNDVPIRECQELLTSLWNELKGNSNENTNVESDAPVKYSDDDIIQQCKSASNGEKFDNLFAGNWHDLYPSQSEADYALIDIIAFYTKTRKQIERIFRSSALGKRDKAKRNDYLTWMIDKSFDRDLPTINIEGYATALEKVKQENLSKASAASFNSRTPDFDSVNPGANPGAATIADDKATISIPSGLIGEIASYIYASAQRPVPEIALAGALALMAGICGRAYNISGTGLNQYIFLLAPTGTGKEAARSGINRLMKKVLIEVPAASEFIGPSQIASGPALHRYLAKSKTHCCVSMFGDYSHKLEIMANERSSGAEKSLKGLIIEIYPVSGHNDVYQPSAYSDSDKNIPPIPSPNFSILADSPPEKFYEVITEAMVADGMLNRFLLIEYNGNRVGSNENHANVQPSSELINKLRTLASHCLKVMNDRSVINVQLSDEARISERAFDKHADRIINSTKSDTFRHLWSRAHLKALKLSALLAIGQNPFNPVISVQDFNWAATLVYNDINRLTEKFKLGETGKTTDEESQVKVLLKTIKDYYAHNWDKVKAYSPFENMHQQGIIPYIYLQRRLASAKIFKDKFGANSTNNLKRAIQTLIEIETIGELNKQQVEKFNTKQKAYRLIDLSMLSNSKDTTDT